MITKEAVQLKEKDDLPALIPLLQAADLDLLVSWLADKEDNFRYKCFLLLQGRSLMNADLLAYWDTFVEKLNSSNSYQRSLGLMLIAENCRWDEAGRFEQLVDLYLSYCDDEKPVTVRQCIQGLCKIVPYHQACHPQIVKKLLSIDLAQRKETQRKLLLMDILSVLALIRKMSPDSAIDRYFIDALTGGILDHKAKRLVEQM